MNQEGKTPGLVNWTGYLAITLAALLPLAVLTVRSGAWQQGLMLYAIACAGSALLLLILIIFLLLPGYALWRRGIAGRAIFTFPGTILLLTLVAGGGDYPPIHDISTDLGDPPVFTAAQQVRGPDANPLDINPEAIEQQGKAYPDVQTLRTDMSIEQAFALAAQVAETLGWEIYHKDLNAGVIEAVDTTAIMAFKDDIVIRLRTDAQGTKLDLRSVSRVGVSDLGANAERIRGFQDAFSKLGES